MAEGTTEGGFETWVLVQNPSGAPVHADVTFQTDSGEVSPPELQGLEIDAGSRKSINAGEYVTTHHVSTKVEATDGEIICERATYWNDRAGGHDSIGVTEPSDTWYLAEGSTAEPFETWVLVQNPTDNDANVGITYMTDSGEIDGGELEVKANTRETINVGEAVPNTFSVSTMVTSDQPVIAERAMYWNDREGGHGSIGTTSLSSDWNMAEGATDGGFEPWVLVQNPNESAANVNITFQTDTGELAPEGLQNVEIPARSRRTFNLGDYVTTYNLSTRVVATSGEVICERATYWNNRVGGHCSVGYSGP